MDKETTEKIRRWEADRDRFLRIRCPRVAAKYQRWIDKELRTAKEQEEHDKGNDKGRKGQA